MIPLRDDNKAQRVPVVTRAIILANVLAFAFELSLGDSLTEFMREWGVVPGRLIASFAGDTALPVELATVLTSMFLHGGWLHLIGNMWYLWIFGDNVEDRMNPVRYLVFYLAAGAVAALVHSALLPGSPVPTVGASGAIAGVLGAAVVAAPRLPVIFVIFPMPLWISVVVLVALHIAAIMFDWDPEIAWHAHLAGLAAGVILYPLLRRRGAS